MTGLLATLAAGKLHLAAWTVATAAASWTAGASLPEPRSEVAAAPLLGRIVVVKPKPRFPEFVQDRGEVVPLAH